MWRRALEKELAELVAAGQVQARIDSHAKVLYARLTDTRAATFQRALKIGAPHSLAHYYLTVLLQSADGMGDTN